MSGLNLQHKFHMSSKKVAATVLAVIFTAAFSTPAIAGTYGDSSDPFDSVPTDNVDLPYSPAEANADFSVPYSDALGSGGYADATAGSQTCAVLSSGAVQCWGYNNYGQVGNGNTTNQTAPSTVTFNS